MNNEEAARRLFELADAQFAEQKDFAAALGITPSIVSEWRRGKSSSFANIKYIRKIAELLGTTTEYILTGETARPHEGDELLRKMQGLSEENRQKARDYIEMLLKLQGRP